MSLFTNILLTAFFIATPISTSTTLVVLEPKPEPPTINELIIIYSKKYNVSTTTMHKIINCESGYKPTVQSGYYHNGIREESYGLVQINLPSHPTITYEQAIDPEFSIKFLAENLSKGNGKIWSCYKSLYGDT